jgi:hypothetical protein
MTDAAPQNMEITRKPTLRFYDNFNDGIGVFGLVLACLGAWELGGMWALCAALGFTLLIYSIGCDIVRHVKGNWDWGTRR